MLDAACAQHYEHVRCELNLPPLDAVGKDGCLEHSILNIERMYGRMPDNYFEVLACLMKD
jgi:hypothetical protein